MFGSIKMIAKKTGPLLTGKYGQERTTWLPGSVLDYLEKRYQLLPKDMLTLKAVHRVVAGKSLRKDYIRIYDQKTVDSRGIKIGTYNDLDKHSDLILYDGYIMDKYIVHLDRNGNGFAAKNTSQYVTTNN